MIIYSVLMFAVATVVMAVAAEIGKGNTSLIMEHHTRHVSESERLIYAKAISGALAVLSSSMFLSGLAALVIKGDRGGTISLAALLLGIGISIILIIVAQIRFNRK